MALFRIVAFLVGLVVLLAGFLSAEAKPRPKYDCSARRRAEVARCILPGQILGYLDLRPPRNESDLYEICRNMKAGSRCGLDYTKECLSGMSASIFGLLMKNFGYVYRSRCAKTERSRFMSHLKCLESDLALPAHNCLVTQVYALQWIADASDLHPDLIIPAMCCSTYPMNRCLKREGDSVCRAHYRRRNSGSERGFNSSSIADAGDFLIDMVADVTGEAMDLFCRSYSNEAVCRTKIPQVMSVFDSLEERVAQKTIGPPPRSYSFAFPLMDIFERPDF